jgi:ankyrin repeat protein
MLFPLYHVMRSIHDLLMLTASSAAIHNPPLMELLLSKGADPNAVDVYNFRPLDCANSVAELELLISHGAKPVKSNALHHAIQTEDDDECYKMMEFLLEKEVNINARALLDKKGRKKGGTALHWAVSGFNAPSRMKRATKILPRVKWLLEKGADSEILDEQKKKALDYADDQEMIDLLKNWVSLRAVGEVIVKTDDHDSRSNENLGNTVSNDGGSRKRKAGSLEGKRKKKA